MKLYKSGQWKVEKSCSGVVLDNNDNFVARTYSTFDARLIAASPDGYALAQHIMAMADDAYFVGHPEWESIVGQAKDLLARVEVEQW
jgi:hypothetical protein